MSSSLFSISYWIAAWFPLGLRVPWSILQKLPDENRQVSHSQAWACCRGTPTRAPALPSLLQRCCAFPAAPACSPLKGLKESTVSDKGLGPGDAPSFPPPSDPSGRKTPNYQLRSHVRAKSWRPPQELITPPPSWSASLSPAPPLRLLRRGFQALHPSRSFWETKQNKTKNRGVLLCSFTGFPRFTEFNSHPHLRSANFPFQYWERGPLHSRTLSMFLVLC